MKALALIASMLLASTAGAQVPAPPAVNDPEFKCHDTGQPLAAPECGTDPYPDGTEWVGLMASAVEFVLPKDYCASPSGAFLD